VGFLRSGPASSSPIGRSMPDGTAGPSYGDAVTTPASGSSSAPPAPAPTATSAVPRQSGPFSGDLLIADRGNGRLLVVDPLGHVVWRFPRAGSLPRGQAFAADDAFISPDGGSIVANDE